MTDMQNNPILQILQYHIFPRMGHITVNIARKFGGGSRTFSSYADIETAYGNGQVHPLDLKIAVAAALIEMLAPVRDHLRDLEVTKK